MLTCITLIFVAPLPVHAPLVSVIKYIYTCIIHIYYTHTHTHTHTHIAGTIYIYKTVCTVYGYTDTQTQTHTDTQTQTQTQTYTDSHQLIHMPLTQKQKIALSCVAGG